MEGGAGGWGGACAVRVHAELETDRCLEVLARGAGMELNGGMVDCHCHLSAAEFNQDIDNILQEARTCLTAHRNAGLVFPCLGVHPVQTETSEQQRSATLQDLEDALPLIELYKDELVAIGEVGLDFTPRIASTDDQKEEQRQVFIRQIELAKHLGLPLNVHSRSAGRPTINLLKEQGAEKVLLHAFDGKPSVAMEGVKAGYFFSIPPSIIRSEQKQKLVKQLPLENMCLETDSPALGPEKQVRNEPKNIIFSAEYIAKIKGISLEEVIEVTTKNAIKLFPKLKQAVHK
ncbi:putative deoxyribonuclease tatdn3-B isoform X3 [Aquarana catesbeiana]|uniref:putative deoxyribonuclease tatdn3-B isoform X3 n=1 Tax=Aquarana catesbeiana TaxID=8400 RepID=UPI003CC96493